MRSLHGADERTKKRSMSKKLQSIVSFQSDNDDFISLKLFKAVLNKMGIKYSLSNSKKERILNGESYWNSRIITITDNESYHSIVDYSERNKKRNPFSGFPGFMLTGDIIRFFCENRGLILSHLQTYLGVVNGFGSFFEYVKKSKYFRIPSYCVPENAEYALFDLFYKKMTPEQIFINREFDLLDDVIACVVWQVVDNVIWNIMNGIEFETFENN